MRSDLLLCRTDSYGLAQLCHSRANFRDFKFEGVRAIRISQNDEDSAEFGAITQLVIVGHRPENYVDRDPA